MSNLNSPQVCVVIPLYNERENITNTVAVLTEVMSQSKKSYELLFINDGSTDGSGEVITTLADTNEHIRVIHFSRNFGKEAALDAGLGQSRGQCIIFIDADLQHPPELIIEMLSRWDEGYEVVNGVKRSRGGESGVYRVFSRLFNRIMSNATGEDFHGATDFKLIDRQVADALLECNERSRFFRGLVAWVGFKATNLEFDVVERQAGDSKWNIGQLLRYSVTNIVSFSSFPLLMVSWVGLITVLIGAVLGMQTLYNYFSGQAVSGFTTVIMLLLLLCGIILLSLGTISLYIAKIYDEQKARPLYIIAKRSND